MNNKGTTLLEIFIFLYIFSIIILFSGLGIQTFLSRLEINNGLRQMILSVSSARYISIVRNKRIRFNRQGNNIVLFESQKGDWNEIKRFQLNSKLSFNISSTPYFYPQGEVVPLFSIILENKKYRFKISCSMAGRLKTQRLWKF